jgi:hypothetical protein
MLMFNIGGCVLLNLFILPPSSLTMHPIPTHKHQIIVSLLLDGESTRSIATKTGISKSKIGEIRKEVVPNKENIKTGCPPKLSPQDRRRVVNQIESGKLDNAVQATDFINSINPTSVSVQTVRNTLRKDNMKSVVKRKHPLLRPAHRKLRLAFAHKYQHWTVDDWKLVLWSDETKVNRIGSDGCLWTWKRVGAPLTDRTTIPTVKHGGGSVMVWGCMGWEGVGVLTEVEGIMDAKQYVEILDAGVMESVEKLGMDEEEFYFQQDNDPKHTSKRASAWFEVNGIKLLDWPPQSPDLNPIEHLWQHVKRQLHKYPSPPTSIHGLWDRIVVEWNKVPAQTCQKLIESMPRRCAAVIKAKGGHTKY